jgi:hypothetical protein
MVLTSLNRTTLNPLIAANDPWEGNKSNYSQAPKLHFRDIYYDICSNANEIFNLIHESCTNELLKEGCA